MLQQSLVQLSADFKFSFKNNDLQMLMVLTLTFVIVYFVVSNTNILKALFGKAHTRLGKEVKYFVDAPCQ